MAFSQVITALLFALAFARIELSACQMVKGKVSCTDCTDNYDFSGIKVSVKCEGVQNKALTTTTEEDGSFKVHLPSHYAKSPSMKCLAKLLGGPDILYASRKNRVSLLIVKGKEENIYTISTPLSFLTYCPQNSECKAANEFGSSKTIDFPMPPAWGLAPSSYYFPLPFFPIIGIP